MQTVNAAGSKKDLRVFSRTKRMNGLSDAFFSFLIIKVILAMGGQNEE